MTRKDFIKKLEELKEELAWDFDSNDMTDKAREEAYMCIVAAIDYISENEE